MASVFVSYAHSNDQHRQRVRSFVAHLRAQNLQVVVDTDVRSPAGPSEGWPRWMENQVENADWVLLFIDETYRRRFDGREDPDKGRGVTWEGCIISNRLYSASTKNTKFIPVLADEADWNLLPSVISGATFYRIPQQQQALSEAILSFEAEAGTASAGFQSVAYKDWRALTVSGIADSILRLQTDRRQRAVAEVFQLPAEFKRDELEFHFGKLVDRSMDPATFDVGSTCLAVARLDALRSDASAHPEDFRALTDLQDWLFALCIHPAVKSTVASGMDDRQGAIIQESVALAVGAELAAAQADGRRSGFRLDDDGRVVGHGLLRLVDTPIGDQDPRIVVQEILKDLADQLCITLSEADFTQQDLDKRILELAQQMQFQAPLNAIAKKRRYYCVIQQQKHAAETASLRKVLSTIRRQIPELVFFELYRGQSKAAEEVILKIVKDRLESETKP